MSTGKRTVLFDVNTATISVIFIFSILIFSGCMTGRSLQLTENYQTMSNTKPSESGKEAFETDTANSFASKEKTKKSEVIKLVSHSEDLFVPKDEEKIPSSSAQSILNADKIATGSNRQTWTFDQAIRATLESDPQLKAGMMLIQEAHADWWTSSLAPNPELSISGGTLPFKTLTPERPGGPPQLDLEIAFPVDWFLFAKRAAGMESARIGVSLSETEYADLIRLRVTTAAIAYYDVLEAKELLHLAREDADVLTQLEQVMKQAREAGGISEIDCKRVQLDRLKSQQFILDAQAQLNVAKAKLWSHFGKNETVPDYEVSGSLDDLPQIQPMTYEEALETARQNRPDIRRMNLQVNQAGANILVEQRNALPEITPSFGYSHQYQECIGDSDYDGWGIGLGVTVPLFDRNQGNRAKALAVMTRAQYELQSGIIDLQAEVREADENMRAAIEKTKNIAEGQVELASQVRNSVIEAYKAGGYHLIDVLNAENSYRETKRLYLTSRADYWRALFVYNSTTGKTSMKEGKINDQK